MAKLNRNLDFDSEDVIVDSDETVYYQGQVSRYEKLKNTLEGFIRDAIDMKPSAFVDRKREIIEEIKFAHLGGEITTAQLNHLKGVIDGRYKL